MSTVCVIPARGGSRRIPRKNIRPFAGLPIIAHSIIAALDTKLFDQIVVSTDDQEIADIAQSFTADVIMRPAYLAADETGTQAVMKHALQILDGAELACCLYATAPLVSPADIIKGWKLMHAPGRVYAFSVGEFPILHDAGQFYWGPAWAFLQDIPLIAEHSVMVPISPARDCDINTEDDWFRAEALYLRLNGDGPTIEQILACQKKLDDQNLPADYEGWRPKI
jgi:pseudaminic acid cytidylyltransferase